MQPATRTACAQAVQLFFQNGELRFELAVFPFFFFRLSPRSRERNGIDDRPASYRGRNFISTVPQYPRLVSPCRCEEYERTGDYCHSEAGDKGRTAGKKLVESSVARNLGGERVHVGEVI